jgi:hypothetical protein
MMRRTIRTTASEPTRRAAINPNGTPLAFGFGMLTFGVDRWPISQCTPNTSPKPAAMRTMPAAMNGPNLIQ